MKLRSKLFLSVGILLLLMVIVMYILPNFFIHRDVHSASGRIHALIEEEHRALVKNQKTLLEDILERIQENLNALLLMIFEEKDLSQKLTLSDPSNSNDAWESVTKIAGYDPEIGFIQLHDPNTGKALALLPHTASFYSANLGKSGQKEIIVTLNKSSKVGNKTTFYRGIPVNNGIEEDEISYLALIELGKSEQLKELKEELKKIPPATDTQEIQNYSHGGEIKPALSWAIKMNMIQVLTPLFVEGLVLEGEKTRVPEGIARIDKDGNGLAILSEDFFRTEAIFDDASYYKKNAPPAGSPPLAEGNAIIIDTQKGHAFLGNTLLINGNTFLTLGSPLSPLVRQLALSSNRIVIMNIDQKFWVGFRANGESLSNENILDYIRAGLTNPKGGALELNDKTYLFAEASTLENGRVTFYNLRSMEGDQTILNTLYQLDESLSNRISLQLFLISLGTLILILIFVGRITLNIIRPITQLANMTSEVAAGHYEHLSYPNVGKRKDEVAMLTLSFQEMVKGIQDREKIHAILDKVVSKEVADEILKKGIQLGGEDRVITMLFGDIRGFTALTENLPPQQTIQMLNECMTKISRVIEGEGGVIDKYVGDEVMAIYGAPNEHADHALRAVSSGMLIVETLKKWNEERLKIGEAAIEMGIGIHTGLVVAGNMGAADRLNYTVLGASVNMSARLCEMAKPNQLIISEHTLAEPEIQKSFHVEKLEPITLKGFSRPINIYQVIGFKWE